MESKPYFNSILEGRGVLNEAVRERRFSDAVLGALAMTEVQMNAIFQLALGITDVKTDKRLMIVNDLGIQFGEKLRFVRETGAITEEEYMRIDKLNRYRNQLLHVKKGKVAWFFTMNETEKGEVIASAWDSASSTFSALIRLTEAYRAALGLKLLSPLPSTVNSE